MGVNKNVAGVGFDGANSCVELFKTQGEVVIGGDVRVLFGLGV